MGRSFRQFTGLEEFGSVISSVSVKREISHIQIHHTWRPRKEDYRGESTILGMWRYHTQTNGWRDIGQHFSVAPDGTIWDGRSLDLNPAGIRGHNSGGLMFEIIGNFDEGENILEGPQLKAITGAVAICQDRFRLTNEDVVFHREHSDKSCPGTGIKKDWFLQMVDRSKKQGKEKTLPEISREVKVILDGQELEQPGYLIGSLAYAPVRVISENLGARVHWDGKVHIDKP